MSLVFCDILSLGGCAVYPTCCAESRAISATLGVAWIAGGDCFQRWFWSWEFRSDEEVPKVFRPAKG